MCAWPVLAGTPGERDVMLSSPIILYDYPALAPESPGPFCDSTEIDELLTLRVMTLTDEEKNEARATDERARAIIDRPDIPPRFSSVYTAPRAFFSPPLPTPSRRFSIRRTKQNKVRRRSAKPKSRQATACASNRGGVPTPWICSLLGEWHGSRRCIEMWTAGLIWPRLSMEIWAT